LSKWQVLLDWSLALELMPARMLHRQQLEWLPQLERLELALRQPQRRLELSDLHASWHFWRALLSTPPWTQKGDLSKLQAST